MTGFVLFILFARAAFACLALAARDTRHDELRTSGWDWLACGWFVLALFAWIGAVS